MGEAQPNIFEPDFNRSIKVKAVDGRLTSHAGAVLLRDFDHRLALTESLADRLIDAVWSKYWNDPKVLWQFDFRDDSASESRPNFVPPCA